MADSIIDVVYGSKFYIPDFIGTKYEDGSILAIGVYNATYKSVSDWDSLTSPPKDRQVMATFAKKVGLRFYCFVDLTNKQLKKLGLAISASMKDKQALFFHFSGHGGVYDNKSYLKQCFLGVDANKEGKGAWSLLKFMQRVHIHGKFCIVICDCCRLLIKADEFKEMRQLKDTLGT
eukprot:UN28888